MDDTNFSQRIVTFDEWYIKVDRYLKQYRYFKPTIKDTFIEDYDNGDGPTAAANRYLKRKGYEV